MNKILDFLRIPLVKFIGVGIIIYLGLFSNRESPDSLRERLSKERLKENIGDVREKSRFIASNLKVAQEIATTKPNQEAIKTISFEEIETGKGDVEVSCGSEVEISYSIFSDEGRQLKVIDSEKLFLGSKNNELLEKNILGMKQGGIRLIKIPRGFVTNNSVASDLMKFQDSGLRYQVSVVSLTPHPESKISCQ